MTSGANRPAGRGTAWAQWWRPRPEPAGPATPADRLSAFHAVMSQTNRLIIRRPEPGALFTGVCRVCVDSGLMDLAVVDMMDGGELLYRASAGDPADGVATEFPHRLPGGARLRALLATLVAHAGGRCVVVDDAATDHRLEDARAACVAEGLLSFAAVPLRRSEVLVGILLLCSRSASFFVGKVMPLLSELGADLSFAMDNADREQERHAASLADHALRAAEDVSRAKTEFLAHMSHELRTPLNAILGFAQLLESDPGDPLSTTQATRVRLITRAGWHLLDLVSDVMDISRIESRHFEVVNVGGDISAVLEEAVALTQPLAASHRIVLSAHAASPFGIGAVVDRRRLLQVMLNLLSNACKYNRPGGHVSVHVTHAGDEVFLDVLDDGIGMTDEHLSHLFEPFNRLGNEGTAIEGSGIGLALTKRLVELMHGRLEFESSIDRGTRARLVLTSCAIPLKALSEDPERRAKSICWGATVLYIEDEPVNRLLVEQMLSRLPGVTLLLAENGGDGLAMARQHRPDLILLDMHLPDVSGFHVLEALRLDPRTDALPVVALSANAMQPDVTRARALGAVDYWTKPLAMNTFLAGVSAHLESPASTGRADLEGRGPRTARSPVEQADPLRSELVTDDAMK
jgi:signal transduction histidine kinase/ActR/RegA family two-component response regulator